MRLVLIVAFVVCLVLTAWSHTVLPERVATHFGADGIADGWSSRGTNTTVFAGLHIGIFVLFWFVPHLIRITPDRWVNLPNKAYWLSDEHRDEAINRMQRRTDMFGAMTFAFFGVTGYLTVAAHHNQPVRLDLNVFLATTGLYLVLTALWCIWLVMAFRTPEPPADTTPLQPS